MKLESVGIDLETADQASAILRKHLAPRRQRARRAVRRSRQGRPRHRIADAGKLFETFRTVGVDSVRVLFAREMESELRKLLASGKLASLSARARKKKR